MTEQKPVAWSYSWAFGEVLTRHDPTERHDYGLLRDVRPLYEHPAPTQPATDPAVEAARRKALRGVLALLDSYPRACDTAPVQGDVTFGVLRDLVGQPRKYPDRAIRGYDNDGPPGPHPVFGKREPDLKASATMRETRVNTADLAQKEAIAPAESEPVRPPPGVQAIAETLLALTDDYWKRGEIWKKAPIAQRGMALVQAKAIRSLVYGRDA